MENINKRTKPLLSICIPTYNRADVLFHCINSIVQNKSFNDDIEIFDLHGFFYKNEKLLHVNSVNSLQR